MRPITVIRFVLLSLLILAGLTMFFALMSPGGSAMVPPRLLAERVGDRVYVAWAGRAPAASARYALTAIRDADLEAWSEARKGDANSLWSTSSSSDEESPWLDSQRGSGELLGLIELDGSLSLVFDGVIRVENVPPSGALGTAGEKLFREDPSASRRIRTTASTMGLSDEFREIFNSFLPADLAVMPTSSASGDEGTTNETDGTGDGTGDAAVDGDSEPSVGAAQTQDADHRLDAETDLVLSVMGLDRFTRLRLNQQTALAEPLGPACYLSLDEKTQELIVLDEPPATTRPGHVGLPGTEPPTEEQNATTQNEGEEDDDRPRFERLLNLTVINGADPARTADAFVSVELRLLEAKESGGEPESVRRYGLYLVRLRDGKWQKPVRVSRHVRYAWDIEADPDNPDLRHLVFVYNAPGKSSRWKYRRIDLRQGVEQFETPVTEVEFAGTSRTPPSLLFELVVAGDRLHLFLMDQGRPVHSMAQRPAADSKERLEQLTFGPINALDAFRARSQAEQWVMTLVVITGGVVLVSLLTVALRVRRQRLEQEALEASTRPPTIDLDADAEQSGEHEPEEKESEAGPAGTLDDLQRQKAKNEPDEERPDPLDPESMTRHFGYIPAGAGVRFFALAVDFMILLVPQYLLADWLSLNIDDLGSWSSPDFWPDYVLMCVLHLVYFSLLEYYFGRTPGKMMFGLRVRNEEKQEHPLSFPQLVLRNALRAADYFAFILMFFSDRSQRLGDRAAKSVVVRVETPAEEESGEDQDGQIR